MPSITKGKLVYAGKALHTTLKGRLNDHVRKIASRQNINVSDLKCRFLIIDSDWYVRAGEHALITSPSRPGCKTSHADFCWKISSQSPV